MDLFPQELKKKVYASYYTTLCPIGLPDQCFWLFAALSWYMQLVCPKSDPAVVLSAWAIANI